MNKMSECFAPDVHTLLTSFKCDRKAGKASNTSRGVDVMHRMSTGFDFSSFESAMSERGRIDVDCICDGSEPRFGS